MTLKRILLLTITLSLAFMLLFALSPSSFAAGPDPSLRGNELQDEQAEHTDTSTNPPVILKPTAMLIPGPGDLAPNPSLGPAPSGTPGTWQKMNLDTVSYNGTSYPLELYVWGNGKNAVIIIGGIHGGHEPNGTKATRLLIDAVSSGAIAVPGNITLMVMPVMNPYGAQAGSGILNGRANGNGVDLNRNWGYNWVSSNLYQGVSMSAGNAAFSEKETQVVLNLIQTVNSQYQLKSVSFMHCCWDDGVVFASRNARASGGAFSNATGYRLSPSLSGNHGEARDYLGEISHIQAHEIELPTWTGASDPDWSHTSLGFQALISWASNP